jgi:hypothetical protein
MKDLIIIGGGPAGLSAAIYAGRAKLDTLLFEGTFHGGQMVNTGEVENYPGMFDITGPELSMKMYEHAQKFGVSMIQEQITELQLEGPVKKVITNNSTYEAKTIILAMGTKAQYDYEGSIWGMAIDENAYLEEYVQEELFAKATLTVTEVAQLTKGKVYELNFFIHGEEVSPKFRETNIHLWVTNEAIYYLTPPDDFDYQKCMVDGKFDYLVYAKVLEETRQLPSDDKTRMLCYETNMEVQDGAYETTISVEGDTCTYSTVHDAGHFIKYEWKAGKGIDYYAYGYGGEREGMRLMRVE